MMWRRADQRLNQRMRQLVAAQNAEGKARIALNAFLPESASHATVQGVAYADGVLTIRTGSKSLAAHLLMQTGPLRTAMKAEGVQVTRIVVL